MSSCAHNYSIAWALPHTVYQFPYAPNPYAIQSMSLMKFEAFEPQVIQNPFLDHLPNP